MNNNNIDKKLCRYFFEKWIININQIPYDIKVQRSAIPSPKSPTLLLRSMDSPVDNVIVQSIQKKELSEVLGEVIALREVIIEPNKPNKMDEKTENKLTCKKNLKDITILFSDRLKKKIEKLEYSQILLEYKLTTIKAKFKNISFIIIFSTVILTLFEIMFKQFDIKQYINVLGEIGLNTILLFPLLLTSYITLLSAWMKTINFEELIENITRAIEKSIIAKSKFNKILEEVNMLTIDYYINENNYTHDDNIKQLNQLRTTKYHSAIKAYLDAMTIIDKNWTQIDSKNYSNKYLLIKNQISLKKKLADIEFMKKDLEYDNMLESLKRKVNEKKNQITK